MPASGIDVYFQDARNNFGAVRPAPVPIDANVVGHCQNVHISTNCYYGYHDPKTYDASNVSADCEMKESSDENVTTQRTASKKRSAEQAEFTQSKRLRQEGMVPTTSNHNPCFHRPTHNNPDISRCLMVHMI